MLKKKQYSYFVHFCYKHNSGGGNTVTTGKKITTSSGIRKLERDLSEELGEDVVLQNLVFLGKSVNK